MTTIHSADPRTATDRGRKTFSLMANDGKLDQNSEGLRLASQQNQIR
jgi:hypothetical protein